MQHADDPWFIALAIILVLSLILTAYNMRVYLKDALILAIALPQALFKKLFGDPPQH